MFNRQTKADSKAIRRLTEKQMRKPGDTVWNRRMPEKAREVIAGKIGRGPQEGRASRKGSPLPYEMMQEVEED